jgi:hypothetical protein
MGPILAVWYSPVYAVTGPDAWISSKLVLRNRRYTDVVVESFLTGAEREDGVVPIREAAVSEERIRKDNEAYPSSSVVELCGDGQ